MASFPYQSPPPHDTTDTTTLHHMATAAQHILHLPTGASPPYHHLPSYKASTTNTTCSIIHESPAAVTHLQAMEIGGLSGNSAEANVGEDGNRRKQKGKRRRGREEGEENPSGYVHVRARRGQATDSHSLAERVRRERISERMKMLQGLVPGCEKVTGKALMLDEIINYVQSLQNQVEFLSMRIASLSPVVYDFGLDMGNYLVESQKVDNKVPTMVPPEQGTCHIQPPECTEAASNYSIMGFNGQGPIAYSQDPVGYARQVGDHNMGYTGRGPW